VVIKAQTGAHCKGVWQRLSTETDGTWYCRVLRRFEQHILPKGFTKIRHAGFLHSRDKMKQIAMVCEQLQLPEPMPWVAIPATVRLQLQTGKDVTVCPVCGKGKLQLVRTLIFHNGSLVDVSQLRNRGSPKKLKQSL